MFVSSVFSYGLWCSMKVIATWKLQQFTLSVYDLYFWYIACASATHVLTLPSNLSNYIVSLASNPPFNLFFRLCLLLFSSFSDVARFSLSNFKFFFFFFSYLVCFVDHFISLHTRFRICYSLQCTYHHSKRLFTLTPSIRKPDFKLFFCFSYTCLFCSILCLLKWRTMSRDYVVGVVVIYFLLSFRLSF